jgi:transcriptional regulator with XRE-family HTH domain
VGLQPLLQKHQIKPAPELEADLAEMRHLEETVLLVEMDRRSVAGIHTGNHHMLAHIGREGEQGLQQLAADTSFAIVLVYMDRMLDGKLVAGPCPKVAKRGETQYVPIRSRNKNRKSSCRATPDPLQAVILGRGCVAVDSCRVGNHLIINGKDSGDIVFVRGPDQHDLQSKLISTIIDKMTTIVNDIDARLSRRIRAEREQRSWTLSDLAAASGVSKAMISKIERGGTSPTAALLGKITGAFGISLSSLFMEETGTSQKLRRKAEQEWWTDPESGQRRATISPPAAHLLELVKSDLPPNARIDYPAMSYNGVLQQIWMLSGTLTFQEGETIHVLKAGDCLELSEPLSTSFRNMSDTQVCSYLVAKTKQK